MTRTDLQFDHLSFALPTEEDLKSLITRLENANCDITTIVDHHIIKSVYFHDNNGIALEASYWTVPIEELGFKPDDETLFADPEPVQQSMNLRTDHSPNSRDQIRFILIAIPDSNQIIRFPAFHVALSNYGCDQIRR